MTNTPRLSFAEAMMRFTAATASAVAGLNALSAAARGGRVAVRAWVRQQDSSMAALWRLDHPGRRVPGSLRTARLRKKRLAALTQ